MKHKARICLNDQLGCIFFAYRDAPECFFTNAYIFERKLYVSDNVAISSSRVPTESMTIVVGRDRFSSTVLPR